MEGSETTGLLFTRDDFGESAMKLLVEITVDKETGERLLKRTPGDDLTSVLEESIRNDRVTTQMVASGWRIIRIVCGLTITGIAFGLAVGAAVMMWS